MEKELCLKFLVHLHKYSASVIQKDHINEVDITYINNEIGNFRSRLDPKVTAIYDRAGALETIVRIPEESVAEKALIVSMNILLSRFKLLSLFGGQKDEAHENRKAKVLEFKDKVKKVIALIEFA